MSEEKIKKNQNEIIVTKKDLPLSCPMKQVWDGHPKIYLDITEKTQITCPYCGLKYKLVSDQ